MDFWRIYRIVYQRRYWILALTAVTMAAIVGYTALSSRRTETISEALLTPQEPAPPSTAAEASSNAQAQQAVDSSRKVSELVTMLRGNNTIYQEAADLLRKEEGARAKEVRFILESNGFFAPIDANIENRLDQMIRLGEMPASERKQRLKEDGKTAREQVIKTLASGRDSQGAFGSAGIPDSVDAIVDTIRDRIEFNPIQGLLATDNNPQFDNLIKVQGRFKREAEANLYVNMLCVAFVHWYSTKSSSSSTIRIAQLKEQRDSAQSDLAKNRMALQNFRRTGPVPLMVGPSDATPMQLQKYEDDLNKAEAELAAASGAVATASGALANTGKTLTTSLPIEENTEVKLLRQRVNEAKIKVAALKQTNKGDNDQDVLLAGGELAASEKALNQAMARPYTQSQANPLYVQFEQQLRASESARNAAAGRVNSLRTQLAAMRTKMAALPAAQADLSDLDRKVKIAESTLGKIEEQLTREQLGSIQNGRGGSIVIASQAHALPAKNPGANGAKLLVYGLILSTILGVVLVIALDAVDNTYKTRDDVEEIFGLPVAGEIPLQLPDPRRAPRIAFLDPLSPVAESYRLLRTDLVFSSVDRPFRSLVAATCKPGHGATTTISNLAITLAQTGKRVILVDADLRRPRLHEVYGVSNERGLTTLLNSQCAIEEALQPTDVENLLLLPSGPLTINPSELLASSAMRTLHERLKTHAQADYILFDAPSAIAFPDASLIANVVDSTLLVVRANGFPRSAERDVRSQMDRARANLIGVVVNGVSPELVDTVHYHNQYYVRSKSDSTPPAPQLPPGGGGGGAPVPPAEKPAGHLHDRPVHDEPVASIASRNVAPEPEPIAPERVTPEDTGDDDAPKRGGLFDRFRKAA